MTANPNLAPDQKSLGKQGAFIDVNAARSLRHETPGSPAALAFLKRAKKRYGRPHVIVTDRLKSYRAAMNVIGNAANQVCGRWLNNRAENSHQPFRRREGAMARFRDIKTLQKFASVHASIHNFFNFERHLNRRDTFKQKPLGRAGRVASTGGVNASDRGHLQIASV